MEVGIQRKDCCVINNTIKHIQNASIVSYCSSNDMSFAGYSGSQIEPHCSDCSADRKILEDQIESYRVRLISKSVLAQIMTGCLIDTPSAGQP